MGFSWRWGWHDGSPRMPSFGYDAPFSTKLTLLKMFADTIKVRMQLSRRGRQPGVRIQWTLGSMRLSDFGGQSKRRGFLATGKEIARKESPLGLYKGLGAVITGIVPKMAIRFTSYEWYKQLLADKETGAVSGQATFFGMLPFTPEEKLRRCLYYTYSWSRCWCDRSRRCCNSHGSDQNSTSSPTS